MKKISLTLACILIGSAALVASCANLASRAAPKTSSANSQVMLAQASPSVQSANNNGSAAKTRWIRTYNLDDLVRESDLIIEGTVVGIQETRLVSSSVFTDYKVDISQVLKSYPSFVDHTINFSHEGGTYQGETQTLQEDGPYQIGEQVFLFLRDISDDPIHVRRGETKYSVLIPGGRFSIKQDGKLDTQATHLKVAETYRGKDKSVLEKDVLTRIPTTSQYLQAAVGGSFLIAEGKVQTQETHLLAEEGTPDVRTYYQFAVDSVIEDKIARYEDVPHKTAQFLGPPVVKGSTITVVEMGGTYEGITKRRSWAQFLQPGQRMVLFLNGVGCGDRIPACSKSEQEANKILYILEDESDRFLIGADNHLTALTHHIISHLYDGQTKERLEQDLLDAKAKWEMALKQQENQPQRIPLGPWLWPTPTPKP